MSFSPPHLSTPPNTPEIQGVSETLLHSISAGGSRQTDESQIFIDQSYTDFHVSPNNSEHLVLDEFFTPSTIAVPPCHLMAQSYPSKSLPLKPANVSELRVGEGALVSNSMPEHSHDAERQAITKGSFSLTTKRVRFISPLLDSANNDNDDLTNLADRISTSTSSAISKDPSSQTTNHVRLLSPLLFDYCSISSESSIYNSDDGEGLMNLVDPVSAKDISSPTATKSVRLVSPPPRINSYSTSASSDDDRSLVGPVSETIGTFSKTDSFKRRETVDMEMAKNRKGFKKIQKKRPVGRRSSTPVSEGGRRTRELKKRKLTKGKGKQHHGRISKSRKSLKNSKKTRDEDYRSSFIANGAIAFASEGPANYVLDHLSLLKDTFFAKVKESWDEAISGYFDSKLKRLEHGQIDTKNNSNLVLTRGHGRTVVRNHLKNLMFPDTSCRIPWATLGIWLWFNKKRFINWDKTVPFCRIKSGFLITTAACQLRKLLFIDLVNWSDDEIKFENSEVPLVVDRKGRVLINVGDLPHLYPTHVINILTVDNEQPASSDDEEIIEESQSDSAESLQSSESSASSSSASSSIELSLTKRKLRNRSYKRPQTFVMSDSDEGNGSCSESEEGESDSDYDAEDESAIDHTKRVSKARMKKKQRRVH